MAETRTSDKFGGYLLFQFSSKFVKICMGHVEKPITTCVDYALVWITQAERGK